MTYTNNWDKLQVLPDKYGPFFYEGWLKVRVLVVRGALSPRVMGEISLHNGWRCL
jgi:hypothetical protein